MKGGIGSEGGGGRGTGKPLAQPKYRTLQRLLQDLEESDYGGIGAWGEFNTNPRRRVSRSFNSEGGGGGGGTSMGGFGVPPQQQYYQGQGGVQQQQKQQQVGAAQGEQLSGGGPMEGDSYAPPPSPQQGFYWGPSSLHQQQPQQPPPQQPEVGGGEGGGGAPLYRDGRMVVYRNEEDMQGMRRGPVGDALSLLLDDYPSRILSIASLARLGLLVLTATGLAYLAVVPRNAPTEQYNYLFKTNLLLVSASLAWPSLLLGIMYNAREININYLIRTFFTAATAGYLGSFLTEIVAATGLKLLAFYRLEPHMHAACPEIPSIHLPWVWKTDCVSYRPRLLTLLIADLAINCLASPIIEEAAKLLCYQWGGWVRATTPLQAQEREEQRRQREQDQTQEPAGPSEGANPDSSLSPEAVGAWARQSPPDRPRRRPLRRLLAGILSLLLTPLSAGPGGRRYRRPESVHSTLVYMTAAALGLKAADNARRILVYTRPQDTSKPFFALARGFFPVHELCGAFTALNLVRRDILGERMSWIRLLAPAVILHSMANFRGMKPIFKWASSSPWTEMQLQALSAPDYATALQQIWKAVWGLVWFAVLARVLGYIMFRHYLLSKQVRLRYADYRF